VATVTGAISSAIEPLTKMAALAEKPLDPAQIAATFALIGQTLQAVQGLGAQISPDALTAAVQFGGQLASALGSVQSAVDLLSSLATTQADPDALAGLLAGVATALAAVPTTLAQGVTDNLAPAVAELHTDGDLLMQGLAGGITDGTHWVTAAARAAVDAAIAAGKAEAGIASPSKRTWAEWGLPLMHGGAGGDTAGVPLFTRAVRAGLDAVLAVPLPSTAVKNAGLPGPPLPAATGRAGGPGGKDSGGSGHTTVITNSTIVNGAVHATTPTATRDLLVGVARREAIKNPGKVG
jgi:hypothetical protein